MQFQYGEKLQELIKIEKKLEKISLTYFNLLIVLRNLVNNLFEGIHQIRYDLRHSNKVVKHMESHINIATVFKNTQTFKMI